MPPLWGYISFGVITTNIPLLRSYRTFDAGRELSQLCFFRLSVLTASRSFSTSPCLPSIR